MLEETATVLSTKGSHALVALVRSEACGSCGAKAMCHPSSDGAMQMEVSDPVGVKPGQKVIVSLPPEVILKASATAYMLPATLIVAGASIGWSRTGTDMGALAGAVAGFAFSVVFLVTRGRKKKDTSTPFISKVL